MKTPHWHKPMKAESLDQLSQLIREEKPSKYKNIKTEYKGKKYPSKLQAKRAKQLDDLTAAGKIKGFTEEVPFRLGCYENLIRVDFVVFGLTETWAEDTKAVETQKFAKDKRLWRKYAPIQLRIIKDKGSYTIYPDRQ